MSSGLIHVATEDGRSEGVFVSVAEDLPSRVNEEEDADAPRIDSVSPDEAGIGDRVTIVGRRFGAIQGDGRVLFRWTSGDPESGSAEGTLPVSRFDFGYEFWSERRIEVRVPDGAVSGALVVETEKGRSNPVPFDITRRVGSKSFSSPRSFALYQDVGVQDVILASDGESRLEPRLYLWISRPQSLPAQRDVQILRREGGSPLFDSGVPGLMLYELGRESLTGASRIGHAYLFTRYAIESAVVPQLVSNDYNMPDRFMDRYTAATADLPVEEEYAASTVQRVIGRAANPYRNAQTLYSYVVEFLSPVAEIGNIPVAKGTEERTGNAFTYAALYTTLLRQAGIPARMVAGAIFTGNGEAVRHYWSEFYIDGVGWIPSDPALADGLHSDRFETVDDRRSYYFGNLDARRVTFSPGRLEAEKLSPHGVQVQVPEMYSLQRYHEEYVGPIESYNSSWYSLIMLGEYGI